MPNRIWIGLLALTLSAGVGAAGVMVVVERALTPAASSTVAAGPGTQKLGAAPSPSEAPAPAAVPGALARTVLLPPAMMPVDPDAPTRQRRATCCSSHREEGPSPAQSQC